MQSAKDRNLNIVVKARNRWDGAAIKQCAALCFQTEESLQHRVHPSCSSIAFHILFQCLLVIPQNKYFTLEIICSSCFQKEKQIQLSKRSALLAKQPLPSKNQVTHVTALQSVPSSRLLVSPSTPNCMNC